METENIECGECEDSTVHLIANEMAYCIVCGVPDTEELLDECEIAYCLDDATHLIVLDPGRSERQSERYCASHVGLAADDARADPARELVYGPVALE